MRILLDHRVHSEIEAIMYHYEREASVEIADKFYNELSERLGEAAQSPKSFPTSRSKGGLRRVNLKRFPYNFLYRILKDAIQVLVVRHHRRHPSFGTRRR